MGFISIFRKIKVTLLGEVTEPTHLVTVNEDGLFSKTALTDVIPENISLQKEISANYTLTLADNKALIWCNSATDINVIVNDIATDFFDCEFWNINTGKVTFVEGTGNLNVIDNAVILEADKVSTIIKRNSVNDYRLKGELV